MTVFPLFQKMKTGAWYVIGFVVAFVYFYVYAVNYIRGVRAEDIELDPVTNIEDFHQRIRRQVQRLQNQPPHHAPHRQMPLPVSQQKSLRRADTSKFDTRQLQHPIHPRYSSTNLGNTFLDNFLIYCLVFTVWKFTNFTGTHILREINFGDFRSAKTSIFFHFRSCES